MADEPASKPSLAAAEFTMRVRALAAEYGADAAVLVLVVPTDDGEHAVAHHAAFVNEYIEWEDLARLARQSFDELVTEPVYEVPSC